jgi:hypothetical protein
VGRATITFTGPIGKLVTSPDGTFNTDFAATTAGRYAVQAHYAGAGIYEPSNSVKIILFVTCVCIVDAMLVQTLINANLTVD